jgi:hypothetical protein
MRARSFTLCFIATSTILLAFVSCNSRTSQVNADPSPVDADKLIQISPARIPIPQAQATFCFADINGPHQVPEILLYANPIAVDYRRRNPSKFDYPVGSKFVKEQFSAPDQPSPDVATVMTRTKTTGEISDWEFTSLALPDRAQLGSANDESCIDCHRGFAERGFISRESEEALRRYLKLE